MQPFACILDVTLKWKGMVPKLKPKGYNGVMSRQMQCIANSHNKDSY